MSKNSLILLSGLSLAVPALAQDATSVATIDSKATTERLNRVGLTLGGASILDSDADTQMQFGVQLATRELNPQLDLGMGIRYFGESAKRSYGGVSASASASSWSFLPNASYVVRTSKVDILLGAQAGLVSVSADVNVENDGEKLMHETDSESRFGFGPRVQLLVPASDLISLSAGIDYLALVDAKDLLNFEAGLSLKF